ncbi:hypothetical protein TNIN_32191 [Trichonephila inaurata madagascariensis]|uniref:Uncharacterized protein n=1 Tax=Trichonephila inaurata madagascariensis TaxID=2747483 RepID=A0A8X6YVU1_9ARAC|nr:hypothetical protein TNIN_32191 [Trichonephila inaurata madagascariensis]
MSDYSGNLDFSPTRQAKIAACEKLRDTVTGISALHKSLLDESLASSPTHRNSFSEIYRMSTQAMAMKKEEMVTLFRKQQSTITTANILSNLSRHEIRVLNTKLQGERIDTNTKFPTLKKHFATIIASGTKTNRRRDHSTASNYQDITRRIVDRSVQE